MVEQMVEWTKLSVSTFSSCGNVAVCALAYAIKGKDKVISLENQRTKIQVLKHMISAIFKGNPTLGSFVGKKT